ncbi:class III lanthionine synthetase LanKC [Streptacidiphilus sp. N1-10]|uniref:Class III lanthionine synthetase LanKC n=1 Tax=Streptacidiphilus jeojiensis TaxID=3229225 RepID=A0ABV6XPB7_9ACTN
MPDLGPTLLYCAADTRYYEPSERLQDEATRYPLTVAEVPAGWRRSLQGLWTVLRPDRAGAAETAEQGWKIHLAAVPELAEHILDTAAAVCLARGVPFKFLRSSTALRLVSRKYLPRTASGKFVTVYPSDDLQFTEVLAELVAALDGLPGPDILGDLRVGRGPVHVRYGAFVRKTCPGPGGSTVLAMSTPSGELVPDVRGSTFRLPDWVPLPPVLQPHLDARQARLQTTRDGDFPYQVLRTLHISNAGGVYLARHRTTEAVVVLREARPYSGLDRDGTEAIERLHREYRTLARLQGLGCVPEVYGIATVRDHHFLIEEYLEGERLDDAVRARGPQPGRDCSEQALDAYARWVQTIVDGLAAALDSVHSRGLCFRDLHPGNVLLRPDGTVALVDFEYAVPLTEEDLPRVGAGGFAAPPGGTGLQADQYGLWATWLWLLLPLNPMVDHDPAKAEQLEAAARERFRLPPGAGPRRPPAPGGTEPPRPPEDLFVGGASDWPSVRDRLVAGIHATATPEREDRLFAAEWAVFGAGGHTLDHGAAGVLLALHRAGVPVPAEYTDWLLASGRRAGPAQSQGLYQGLHGTAAVLDELGCPGGRDELLARTCSADRPTFAGLARGQAGVALNLARLALRTGDGGLLAEAEQAADRLEALLGEGPGPRLLLPAAAGLLHGLSGSALLQLRLYRITGEQRRLTAARAALAWELEHCAGPRLPYLDGGGGVALVAREYLEHRDDPELSAFLATVRGCCADDVPLEPGLFGGRAGQIAVLARLGGTDAEDQVLTSVRRLAWHAVPDQQGLFFPGAGLRRLSADLATGAAGILLALHTVFEAKGDLLAVLPTG